MTDLGFKAPIGRETEMSFVVVQLCGMSVFLEVSCFCFALLHNKSCAFKCFCCDLFE